MRNKALILAEATQQWLALARNGKQREAAAFYETELFPLIVLDFMQRNKNVQRTEVLISLLGFSPEPIILMAGALQPEHHILLAGESYQAYQAMLDQYLPGKYAVQTIDAMTLESFYQQLSELVSAYPGKRITFDITGGKKSMVAIVSIFARDHGCRLAYLDFEDYLADLRKPLPGTEVLKIIYDPDQKLS